jgi:hypothetical protein
MLREPHRDHDAHAVDDHRSRVARKQAHAEDDDTVADSPDAVQKRERQHRERRDHEVDPGAGLLDQKHTFRREVTFARDRREHDTSHQAHEMRGGRQHP